MVGRRAMEERAKNSAYRIKVRKPFKVSVFEKVVCPYCKNQDEFYEVVENVALYVHYLQTEDGRLEPIEEELELYGPTKFYCGKCHADLTFFRKKF